MKCNHSRPGFELVSSCPIPTTITITPRAPLDNMEGEELSWCPYWSNSLWQGWSCGLVHCPAGNATDPIWISAWTPLKPQHSNPNPNPNSLANQLWCIDFLPHLSSSLPLLKLLCHSKTDARFVQDGPKSIPYVSVPFFQV